MEKIHKNIEYEIIKHLEVDIAIFNFKKELKSKSSKFKSNNMFLLKKVAIFALFLIIISSSTLLAYGTFKKIIHPEISFGIGSLNSPNSIKQATDSGYIENIEMNYIYSNNIGCKINSLVLSDNDLCITFDFDFKQNHITRNNLLISFIIYDENNNIYLYENPLSNKKNIFLKNFYKDMNINYNKNDLFENIYSTGLYQDNLIETENQVISQFITWTDKKFPHGKTLYAKVFDIGFRENDKFKSISNNSEWNIKIDLPEKFCNRTYIKYELKESIPNFNLYDLFITDTSMTMLYKSDYQYSDVIILNEDGKDFTQQLGKYINSEGKIVCKYYINKNILLDKLYLKIISNNEVKQIELIRVK